MRPKELKRQLIAALKARDQILIKGPPGLGKTAIVTQAAAEAGMDLRIMHPAIADPTDFRGFPARSADGRSAEFLPFGDLAALIAAKRPTLALVDDLGQAPESVQKALMQLLHGRRLNEHRLPDHVVFCGATNDVKQMAGVTGIIEPVKSRWTSIVALEGHIDDWTEWALAQPHIPPTLIAFLRSAEAQSKEGPLLFAFKATRELTNSPCPRTWEAVGRMLSRGCRNAEMLGGAVGVPAAAQLLAFLELADTCPTMAEITTDPRNARIPDSPSLKGLLSTAIARAMAPGTIAQFMTYLHRLEQPFRILAMGDMHRRLQHDGTARKAVTETRAYVEWATKEGSLLAG